MNVPPAPSEVPPAAAAYQLMVPADAVAPRITVPGPQRAPGVVPVMVGTGLTVTSETVADAAVQPVIGSA